MPGVAEERKDVQFTLVKRKTDESLVKILCNLLKTQNVHGKDGKSTCKLFLLCGILTVRKLRLPGKGVRLRGVHPQGKDGSCGTDDKTGSGGFAEKAVGPEAAQ